MIKPNLLSSRMGNNNTDDVHDNLVGLNDLCEFFKMNKSHTVLELGSYSGISTSLFAYYAKEVIAIDLNKSDKLENTLNLYPNIKFKQGNLNNIVSTLEDNYFDFIYIDAEHDYNSVLNDIKTSLPKLKKQGIMCGHDFGLPWPGVINAVSEIFHDKFIKVFGDNSWAVIEK